MPVNVAIVGAGPAGFYTAEALLRRIEDARIDFIERLATPYGLIRAGVAPDHQTTKKVSAKFARTAGRAQVRYFGNVEVGRDVRLAELLDLYDAVVLAVGAPVDRYLGIPGEDKRGVYGAALFVGWYNGHPDFRDLDPDLDAEAAVVVGNGNVALDVARVLVKSPRELADTDIAAHAAGAIEASSIRDVYLLGRRGPVQARFSNVELREMGRLENCAPVVDADQLPDSVGDLADRDRRLKEKNLLTLREFAGRRWDKPKRVHFRFYSAPVEIIGGERAEGMRIERTRLEDGRAVGTGAFEVLRCGLVVVAIGYQAVPLREVPFDLERGLIRNEGGRVVPGLYAVGWAKRGPVGVISSNRPDGIVCAEQIAADIRPTGKPGGAALRRLLDGRGVRVVSFADWQRIDAVEVAAGGGRAPRRKITSLEEMLALLERSERLRSRA